MDPERWRQIEEIYHAALEQPPGQIGAFLDQACQGNEELRCEVESLLAQEEVAGPMDRPVWVGAPNAPFPLGTKLQPGAMVGRYRILRLVGEGGMGAVYEAEQDKPRRTVALKLIKPGLASPEVLRRFERESQALGRLQHPGIAQIYEAGAADSGFGPQPYFAMEFIRGENLREYAALHRLDIRQRLELMAKICDAVQHAHQRGLIHRDLKPGNILVEETGQPRILDFGVARVRDVDAQESRQTDLGQVVGTLTYMSPEQVLADPLELDTRSDVYALGVILYELLAGRLPYQVSHKLHEAVHAICEEDPSRLSSIDRLYRGDVETIVAKALEKDKARRYASAADLAADIRRFLDCEPIVARPPTATYQLHKFAQRHRALVAGVAAVFVVLLAGVVASTWQALRANRATQAAIAERDRATSAERRVTQERDRAAVERNRAVTAEAQAVEQRNRAVVEKQRADTESAAARAISDFLRNDLLSQASASTQASPNTRPDPDLKVRTALDRAAARIEGKFDKQPLVQAEIRSTISETYLDLGLYPEAGRQIERALELRRRALGNAHPDTLKSRDSLASLYYRQGKFAQAEPLHAEVLEIRRRSIGEEHIDTLKSMNNLADAYRGQGKYAQAEPLLKRTVELKQRVLGLEDNSTLVSMNNLALLYLDRGDYSKAEPLYLQVLEVRRRLLGEEHPRTLFSAYALASVYWRAGQTAPAEPLFQQVYQVQHRVLGEAHPETLRTMNALATVFLTRRNYAQAEPLLLKGHELRRRVQGEEHPETLLSVLNLARLYREQGNYQQAEAIYGKVLEAQRRTRGEEHPETTGTRLSLGAALVEQRKFSDAEPLLRAAASAYAKTSPGNWQRFNSQSLLGASLAGQKKYAEAEPLLVSGFEGLMRHKASVAAQDPPALERARQWITRLYQEWGKPERAAEWRDR